MDRPSGATQFGEAFPALLAAAREQASWAWRDIHGWLASSVAGYLRMQGASDVDDLTSEVFIGVFRGIAEFDGDEPHFRSWVFVIAHRRMIDQRRRRSRRPIVDDVADVGDEVGGDAELDALDRLGGEWVEELCAQLASDQRDVLLLRLVGDLTVEQVAGVLGKSAGAVKALQRRGLESIRRILVQQGVPL